MVLASVAAEVVPSERMRGTWREERREERKKKRGREREDARWMAGSGRGGWVSTGVSWLVWWANVCLLAASEPVNHYGPRKRLRTTFVLSSISSRPPPSVFSLPLSKPSSHSLSVDGLLSLSLSLSPSFLSLSHFLSLPFPSPSPSRPLCARSSPSFPSVPSSPRCSVLQARYNAARRRPSCIFKRAVLLCSRYRPHQLDRPLDDRSPPSPTSVSLPAALLSLAPSLPPSLALSFSRGFSFSVQNVLPLPSSAFSPLSFSLAVCAAIPIVSAPASLSLFSVHYDAIKNFSGGYDRVFERFYAASHSTHSDGTTLRRRWYSGYFWTFSRYMRVNVLYVNRCAIFYERNSV